MSAQVSTSAPHTDTHTHTHITLSGQFGGQFSAPKQVNIALIFGILETTSHVIVLINSLAEREMQRRSSVEKRRELAR